MFDNLLDHTSVNHSSFVADGDGVNVYVQHHPVDHYSNHNKTRKKGFGY